MAATEKFRTHGYGKDRVCQAMRDYPGKHQGRKGAESVETLLWFVQKSIKKNVR